MIRSIEAQVAPKEAGPVEAGFEGIVPLGLYGTNEEIARLALLLASDASGYCNGTAFVADGGLLAT